MSKAAEDPDELLQEYDFSSMAGGVRGKYHRQYREGVNLVLLEPDLARAFPTDVAVNDALRKALRAAEAPKRRAAPPNSQLKRRRSAKARRRGTRS
jgi:hypothetical protein